MFKISVIMGSQSDWKVMKAACEILELFSVSYEKKIVSAHRTPERMFSYAKKAVEQGVQVIIAGAGGAAHLPGMIASLVHIPVLGVPIASLHMNGLDSLLSIVQMPRGVPVGTLCINGSYNAGLLAVRVLALSDKKLEGKLLEWQLEQTNKVAWEPLEEK